MARTAHHAGAPRRPLFRICVVLLTAVAICVAQYGIRPAAAQEATESAGHVGPHHDLTHAGAVHETRSSDARTHYLTINVSVSDAAIEPSSIFIPAGQPVQLMLRNRSVSEHHYRVVGLIPDDIAWMVQGGAPQSGAGSDEGHNHHDRTFVGTRATSPAGITPAGNEVHAYVSRAQGIDAVLFTPTLPGAYVVRCELHPEKTARLEVFERVKAPAASLVGPGNASSHASEIASDHMVGHAEHVAASASSHVPEIVSHSAGRALTVAPKEPLIQALSRDLGWVGDSGVSSVFVEAIYAPPEHISRILGGPIDVPAMPPDTYVAIVLTEGVHAGTLPGPGERPELYVSGHRLPLVDSTITTELPHHRATFYRFARTEAFGTGDQVLTLRLVSGQEATWHLSSWNGDWSRVFAGGAAASLGLVGWLLWALANRRMGRLSGRESRLTP